MRPVIAVVPLLALGLTEQERARQLLEPLRTALAPFAGKRNTEETRRAVVEITEREIKNLQRAGR